MHLHSVTLTCLVSLVTVNGAGIISNRIFTVSHVDQNTQMYETENETAALPDTKRAITRSRSKKGVGIWYAKGTTASIPKVGAIWFYDWTPSPQVSLDAGPVPSGIEPVAMIGTLSDHTPELLRTVKANYKTVLGFNEPDGNNITPQQAVDAWPDTVATGLRIGSPAPAAAQSPRPGTWSYDFMKGVNNRVDLIALYFYSANTDWVVELEKYVTDVHKMYQKPIWITEFVMVNYSGSSYTTPDMQTEAQNVISACKMLNSLSFVERHAWFALPQNNYQRNTYLFDNTSVITVIGEAYRSVP